MRLLNPWRRSRKSRSPLAHRAQLRVEQLESRVVPYSTSGNAWPVPQLVSLSFEPDGTNLGGVSSNLFATFNAKWSTTTWQNQFLRAAQVWAQQTNLNVTVIADNGGGIGSGSYQQGDANLGDIRIGGFNFGSGTLASAYLPPPVNNYSIAGDIQFNTGQVFNIGSTYDLWTVAAHEIGHALGLLHSTVSTAVMYGSYNTRKTVLNSDDISGIQAIYGGARTQDTYDVAAPNGTFATATNIQGQIDATTLAALVNNLDITTTSDLDYYTFTAPAGTNSSFTVTLQSKGLSLLGANVTVYAADKSTQLGTATSLDRTGCTLTLTISNVSAGQQFYVKSAGADTTAFGTGAYALVLNFGSGAAPTVTPPNTQTLNGNPLSSGGGQPDSPPDVESPGKDVFEASGGAHEPAATVMPMPSGLAALVAEGGAPPTLTPSPAQVPPATAAAPLPVIGEMAVVARPLTLNLIGALNGSGGPETAGRADTEEWEEDASAVAPVATEPVAVPSVIRQAAEPQSDEVLSAPACDACFAASTEVEYATMETAADTGDVATVDGVWMTEIAAAVAAVGLWNHRDEGRESRRRPLAQIR